MTWRRLGRVYVPDGSQWWARSNASYPTAEVRDDGRIRVYFTALDERQDGRVGYVDVDAGNPLRVVASSSEPVLDVGALGEFDDCGANAFGIVTAGSRRLLYYQGWQRTAKVPLIFSSVAISVDGGSSFSRLARVPALDRTAGEPYLRGAPYVLRDDGRFRMWYASGTKWSMRVRVARYRVVVRTAVSDDGLRWDGETRVSVEPEGEDYAIGRPCVVRDGGVYRMWYSIRSFVRPYRIGYAESRDGVSWTR